MTRWGGPGSGVKPGRDRAHRAAERRPSRGTSPSTNPPPSTTWNSTRGTRPRTGRRAR